MENLTIHTAQKARTRFISGTHVIFTSSEDVNIGDYFTAKLDEQTKDFKVTSVIAAEPEPEVLLITAELLGRASSRETIDLRKLVGLTLAPVVDEERIKVLRRAETLC